MSRPIHELLPALEHDAPFVQLGQFPTPVEPLAGEFSGAAFIKRDDLSSPVYGGNKVRTLEVLFGAAKRAGCSEVVSTGAYGSNHAVATILHAAEAGFDSAAILCPQPASHAALENLEVSLSYAGRLELLPHWLFMPWAMWRFRQQSGGRSYVMAPGGATPLGALGYVSATLELLSQVQQKALPEPRRIVLPVGSTCTSAGLLAGLWLARYLGLGYADGVPLVHAVRVTPWPVTSPVRILSLAKRVLAWIADHTAEQGLRVTSAQLAPGLYVDSRFLGAGYGRPTPAGRRAMERLGEFGRGLDTTYSAKAAAGLIEILDGAQGPTLFWATKSTAALPPLAAARLAAAPNRVRAWMAQARQL